MDVTGIQSALRSRDRSVIPTRLFFEAAKPGACGKRGLLVILLLSQVQRRAGLRPWNDYQVELQRGEALVSARRLGSILGSKRDTVSRWLDAICAALDWPIEQLEVDDPRVHVGPPQEGAWSGGMVRDRKRGMVGLLIFVSDYEWLSAIDAGEGGMVRDRKGGMVRGHGPFHTTRVIPHGYPRDRRACGHGGKPADSAPRRPDLACGKPEQPAPSMAHVLERGALEAIAEFGVELPRAAGGPDWWRRYDLEEEPTPEWAEAQLRRMNGRTS